MCASGVYPCPYSQDRLWIHCYHCMTKIKWLLKVSIYSMAIQWLLYFPRCPVYIHRINDTISCSHHEIVPVVTSAVCFCLGFCFGSVSGPCPVNGFVMDFIHLVWISQRLVPLVMPHCILVLCKLLLCICFFKSEHCPFFLGPCSCFLLQTHACFMLMNCSIVMPVFCAGYGLWL